MNKKLTLQKKCTFLFPLAEDRSIYFFESSPSWAERRDNGRIDTRPVRGGGRTSNLFNIIREMTLRSEKRWIPPWTANRNNGAALIVTLQSGTQWAIRGGLIRGVERWMTLWKGHCALYLQILIFPTLGLLREFKRKWRWDRKSTTPVWLQTQELQKELRSTLVK